MGKTTNVVARRNSIFIHGFLYDERRSLVQKYNAKKLSTTEKEFRKNANVCDVNKKPIPVNSCHIYICPNAMFPPAALISFG